MGLIHSMHWRQKKCTKDSYGSWATSTRDFLPSDFPLGSARAIVRSPTLQLQVPVVALKCTADWKLAKAGESCFDCSVCLGLKGPCHVHKQNLMMVTWTSFATGSGCCAADVQLWEKIAPLHAFGLYWARRQKGWVPWRSGKWVLSHMNVPLSLFWRVRRIAQHGTTSNFLCFTLRVPRLHSPALEWFGLDLAIPLKYCAT